MLRPADRCGNGQAILDQAVDVKPNGIADFGLGLLGRRTRRDPAGQIGHMG
jgi:hypothetical protein